MSDWRSVALDPPEVGAVVNVTFIDNFGLYEGYGDCVLNDDGKFYLIEPPTEITARVVYWRPAPSRASKP
jgi:hypothetical protein